ncbi:hypothetical protein [Actinomadura formosensis]|uniref:hypothetical protein n=1 Tax=Actinomadura formosensis TaxID=60706 RepID=UPI003D8C8C6E
MTMRRMLVMAGGAVLPIALLSLLLDNQWVVDAINDTGLHYDEGLAPPLWWLQFPHWRLTGGPVGWKFTVALDFTTVLFFVLLILLGTAGARAVEPNRGGFGALVTGWWATTVAGGVAGLVQGALLNWALDLPNGGPNVFEAVSHGASFGLGYGWLAGLGMLLGYLITRTRGVAGRQPGPYPPQQPGMPMQPPYGQPMAQQPMQPMQPGMPMQPPYVPPQGQPQQHAWAGPPVPQQPGPYPPQQPVPPQQPAPPIPPQPSAPPIPPQPSAPPPEQVPPAAPEDKDEAPEAEPKEPPQDAAQDAPQDSPQDSADDDLDLADRTVIDRKRDAGES